LKELWFIIIDFGVLYGDFLAGSTLLNLGEDSMTLGLGGAGEASLVGARLRPEAFPASILLLPGLFRVSILNFIE